MFKIFLIIVMCLLIAGIVAIIIKMFALPVRVESVKKLIHLGKNQEAAKIAKQIITKNPNDFHAHYYLGQAYLADGKNELALMEFNLISEKAVFDKHLPEVEFRSEYAVLQLTFKKYDKALKEFLLLTKLDPKNAENFFQAGKLYERNNRKDLALGFYKKCIKLDKRHGAAHGALGYLLFLAKQFNDARRELDLAIRLSPDNFANYYYLGKLLKEKKDLGGAVKAFDKAQRDIEFKQKALIERALCYMIANRYDNVEIDLQRAIEFDKDDSKSDTLYARYFLAACYEKNRKIDKAIVQWEQIAKKKKNFRDVMQKLEEYKDVQTNDHLKDYLTCSYDEFVELCKAIAFKVMDLQTMHADTKDGGCEIIATDAKESNFINVRRRFTLLRFYREADSIEEKDVREVLERAKASNCTNSFMITSSDFSESALDFAANRPVELITKTKLEEFLSKVN